MEHLREYVEKFKRENENNKMIFSMEFGNEVIGIESFHKQTYYLKEFFCITQ